MPPADLYLIRHAQSEWNAAGRWQGQADPALSATGVAQARKLAARVPLASADRLITSDLERARATAVPLAAALGLELEVDAMLREIDVGSWSGKTRAEIAEEQPGALDRYYRGESGWTGGETFAEHELRSGGVARRITALDVEGAVVVVTHGGTLRAILRTLLEIPHAERWRLSGPGHASITHLQRSPHGWRMRSFNA